MAMEEGAILEGTVVNITNFGAFIDIDGTTGLVHISEIADTYVKDIRDFLEEGQKIKVKVLKVEPTGKISLSVKDANPGMKPKEGTQQAYSQEHGNQKPPARSAPREDRSAQDHRPHRAPGDDWSVRRPKPMEKGPQSFEDMMSRFQKDSEEKLSEYKRRQDAGGNVKRKKG